MTLPSGTFLYLVGATHMRNQANGSACVLEYRLSADDARRQCNAATN